MALRDAAASAGLSWPQYGGRELGAVMPAALDAVGAGHVVTIRDAAADRATLGLPQASQVVLVLIDGLGHHLLEARRGHAPFLRGISAGSITAGFPTTTATSLATFGTGASSGTTGMTGYSVRNPTTGQLANLVSWEGAEDPHVWQQAPSLLEEAQRSGVEVTSLGKKSFVGSGLTLAALRGGRFVGSDSLAERVDHAIAAASRPGLTYCYWGDLDATGHKLGWQSDAWVAALESADRELSRLARSLPADALMVVTADHGMVDVTGAPQWDVARNPELARDVEIVAGEPRAIHVHVWQGKADDVAARWRDVLGEHAVVATKDEAIDSGLFGEVAPVTRERIGDVVVAMTGRATVVDSRTQSAQSLRLVGMHGSLTPEELDVPLLVTAG